eukprot:13658436-Alexandrium_andersonii.AAC.1
MSASLVGSEMCIRDRRPAIQGCLIAHVRAQAPSTAAQRSAKILILGRCCLLYTSDAADDM